MSKLRVYHGSYCEENNPSLDNGRIDADFGIGFYVTTDIMMAEKWACRKKKPIINEYTAFSPYDFDILKGATADDKLFATIEQYESGFIDSETAVEVLNCMKIGQQICIRTKKGLENLHFIKSTELTPEQVKQIREANKTDRKMANQLTSDIIRNHNKRKDN